MPKICCVNKLFNFVQFVQFVQFAVRHKQPDSDTGYAGAKLLVQLGNGWPRPKVN